MIADDCCNPHVSDTKDRRQRREKSGGRRKSRHKCFTVAKIEHRAKWSIERCGWVVSIRARIRSKYGAWEKGDDGRTPRLGLGLGLGCDAFAHDRNISFCYYHSQKIQLWHRLTALRQAKCATNCLFPSRTRTIPHQLRFCSRKALKLWYTALPSSHLRQLVRSNIDQQSHGDTAR